MKNYFFSVWILILLLTGCGPRRAPIPVGVIPDQRELSRADENFGRQVFEQLSQQYSISRSDSQIERIRRITDRLTSAAGVDRNPWHVILFNDDSVENAAATRGNHVFVWSGLLRKVRNDDELATVISHEIAHVLSGHTEPNPSEEVSEIASGVSGSLASQVIAARGGGPMVADLAEMALREGLKALLVNPEAQRKELEADQVGLFIMADAGYDPQDALSFWERLKDAPGFSGMPLQFLSSHPSSAERIRQLRLLMREADSRFARSVRPLSIPSRDSFDLRRRQSRH